MIKFIPATNKMDFEKSGYFVVDYEKVNIEFSTEKLTPFSWDFTLPGATFWIQEIVFNENTNTYTWSDTFQLNNTYEVGKTYETYTFATPLDIGIYRIGVKAYGGVLTWISANLIKAVPPIAFNTAAEIADDLKMTSSGLVNSAGDQVVNSAGDLTSENT